MLSDDPRHCSEPRALISLVIVQENTMSLFLFLKISIFLILEVHIVISIGVSPRECIPGYLGEYPLIDQYRAKDSNFGCNTQTDNVFWDCFTGVVLTVNVTNQRLSEVIMKFVGWLPTVIHDP